MPLWYSMHLYTVVLSFKKPAAHTISLKYAHCVYVEADTGFNKTYIKIPSPTHDV